MRGKRHRTNIIFTVYKYSGSTRKRNSGYICRIEGRPQKGVRVVLDTEE